MIKAVIFDLDGTLLDRDMSLKRFVSAQHDRIKALHKVPKEAFLERFVELDARGYVWKDVVYQSLIEEFELRDTTFNELLSDYEHNFYEHCVGFPHMREVLEYFHNKHIKLAMITNGLTDLQLGNINALGIAPYFEFIMVSEQEGVRKPDPEIFLRALRRLNVEPSEAVYVGDHPVNDIAASRAVGMKAVWKKDVFYDDDFDRDGTIEELNELVNVIEGW